MQVEKVQFPSVVTEKATSVTLDSILQEYEQIFMGEKDVCSKIWVSSCLPPACLCRIMLLDKQKILLAPI